MPPTAPADVFARRAARAMFAARSDVDVAPLLSTATMITPSMSPPDAVSRRHVACYAALPLFDAASPFFLTLFNAFRRDDIRHFFDAPTT